MLKITMPRGDMKPVEFYISDIDSEDTDIEIDEIYFTVKKGFIYNDIIFQKRLSTGEIEQKEGYTYSFVIEPEDTDNLKFGEYSFDIEIVGPSLKKTFVGKLILSEEATWATNEGG